MTVEGADYQSVSQNWKRVTGVCDSRAALHMANVESGAEACRETCKAACGTLPGTETHQRSGVVVDNCRVSSSLWKLCAGCMNESRVNSVL